MNVFEKQLDVYLRQSTQQRVELTNISVETLLFVLENTPTTLDSQFFWFTSAKVRQDLARFTLPNVFVWDLDLQDPTDQILNQQGMLNLFFRLYEEILFKRAKHIILPWELAYCLLPPLEYFRKKVQTFKRGESIPQDQLQKVFLEYGYNTGVVGNLEPTQFAFRGDVCDFHTQSGKIYRLNFFDDVIESIHEIDAETNRTIKNAPLREISFIFTWRHFTQGTWVNTLRENLPVPTPRFKEKFKKRKEFFDALNKGEGNIDFYHLALLFEKCQTLLQQINPTSAHLIFVGSENALPTTASLLSLWEHNFETQKENDLSGLFLPEFQHLFTSKLTLPNFGIFLDHGNSKNSLGHWIPISEFLKQLTKNEGARLSRLELLTRWMKQNAYSIQNITFIFQNEEEKQHLNVLLESRWKFLDQFEQISRQWCLSSIGSSSFDQLSETLLLWARDFIYTATKNTKVKNRHVDLFAEHLSTLREGDFVVHQTFGIGKFVQLQNMTVSGQNSDFIVLKYLGDDKVYVPVYKMNLLEKYADAESTATLSDLRSKKFELERQRAKNSVKKLAFDLLRLEAERKSHIGFAFSAPDEYFEEFESSFPFTETPDQAQAISDVTTDMCKPSPMDRLICGDVGFGKTEVAMRAAFKAILDKKQVVVLVPTTILCLQHFNNFKKRMGQFGVQVEQLSRLITPKQAKETLERLANGKCDLVIATHKILSKSVSFFDLGLVIVDEEHRFGVGDKEKLKLLRANIDFLTLTATPIPRTLQMSFLGIKPLSLIQTPPPERQSIQTQLIREDWDTIRHAIKKEFDRGGQVFYIYNRVMDIELMAQKIREAAPTAKLVIAHGQLNERDLEKRIHAFYNREFDILLATTIVESGLDIPTANTMIIHDAQKYGLAQLHQLRGRIGRSNHKAYCYFVIPEKHQLTDLSSKRLDALQKYCDIGAGFALANSDLEIRGAGELLGGEQSGHIQNIGLELYLSLLEEAMAEIKGEKQEVHIHLDVQLGLSCYIPQSYIQDEGARIKFYKKLANSNDLEVLKQITDELVDIYGPLPEFVSNLLLTLKIRLTLRPLGLKSLSQVKMRLHLKFELSALEQNPKLSQTLIQYFMAKPKQFKFVTPTQVDYFSSIPLTPEVVLDFCQNLRDQFQSIISPPR